MALESHLFQLRTWQATGTLALSCMGGKLQLVWVIWIKNLQYCKKTPAAWLPD